MLRRSSLTNRHPGRTLFPFLLALIAVLLESGVVLAHSNLERSDPSNGAILLQAPADVRLWFSEDLEPSFSRAVVHDGIRQPVSTGSTVATDDPRLLVVDLEPRLASGWYVVSWQAQAKLDGHLTRGTITFGVGVTGPPPGIATAARTAANGSGSVLEVVLRWLILLSAIVVVGSFAFWALQSRKQTVGPRSPRRARILPAQWAIAELAWIVFILANVVFLTNAVAVASDASSLDDLGPPLVVLATQTTFGQLWLARVALASVLGIILLYRGNDCPSSWDRLALVVGAGLLLSFSLASHSAALPSIAAIAVANDWLHFATVTIWIGGLIQLAVVMAVSPGRPGHDGGEDIRWDLARRFGAIATYALALVAVTGLFEALYHVATPFNLVHSPYGRVVVLKTLLVVPLVVLAALHRRAVRSHGFRGHPNQVPSVISRFAGTPGFESWLPGSVRFEALWAVLVVAVVGLLTSLSPP